MAFFFLSLSQVRMTLFTTPLITGLEEMEYEAAAKFKYSSLH